MKTILFILAFVTFVSFSQDTIQIEKIDSIRLAYDSKINKSVEEEMAFFPPRIKLESTLMERAIGEVKTNTTIYFDTYEDELTGDGPPLTHALIRKVEVTVKSGSYLITTHFCFDENGTLNFYYYKIEGYECYEKLLYFSNDYCLQMTQTLLEGEDCNIDSELKNYIKYKFDKTDKAEFKAIRSKVNNYRSILDTYFEYIKG